MDVDSCAHDDASSAPELFAVDDVDFVGKGGSVASASLRQCLSSFVNRARTDLKCRTYRRLLKIVENILLNPWDRAKRRLRESNAVYAQHIAPDPDAVRFLASLGFRSVCGFSVLQVVSVPLLREAYRALLSMLRDEFGVSLKSLEGHFFDPFKAYKHDSDVCKNLDQDDFECRGVDATRAQIEALSSKLSEADSSTGLPCWNPKIYIEESGSCGASSSSSSCRDSLESKHSASHVMKIYNVGKCGDFASVSRKHLDALQRQLAHAERSQTVELKIRLPASTVLVLDVPMKTPASKLKSELQSILVESVSASEWDLVEMPTRRVLDECKTLLQQEISHRVMLHLRFKGAQLRRPSVGCSASRGVDCQLVRGEILRAYFVPRKSSC